MNKNILITGSSGLVGSECVRFFGAKGFKVVGIDNDMRKYFFGDAASTNWNLRLLKEEVADYIHYKYDIRDKRRIEEIFKKYKFSIVIHSAAQPSHDWAAREPMTDFEINANGTQNLLEAARKYSPESIFVHMSTNKVYGDNPNKLPLKEYKTRYDLPRGSAYKKGIDETMSLDHCTHSIFGVSKIAADQMVQEYGRYFGMYTACFRAGCITGPAHSAAKLHGFLAYLTRTIFEDRLYTIIGYKGKQVRDNIHSHDLANAIYHFTQNPKKGAVYNIGGSRHSNTSIHEAIQKIEKILGKNAKTKYSPKNRVGDHIWYISDVSKFQKDFPKWKYRYDIDRILEELCLSFSIENLKLTKYNPKYIFNSINDF